MRRAGDVCFSQVFRDASGIVLCDQVRFFYFFLMFFFFARRYTLVGGIEGS